MLSLKLWHRIGFWFKDKTFTKLFKDSGVLLSGNVGASLFRLAYLTLTVRALTAKDFGILVILQTYVAVLGGLFNFQSWQMVIKYGAEALEHKQLKSFKGLVKFGIVIDTLSALVAALVAVSAAYWVGGWRNWPAAVVQMAMVYSVSIVFQITGVPTAVLRLFDRFHLVAVQDTVSAALKLAAVTVAYCMRADLWTFLVIWISGDIAGNLLLMLFAWSTLVKEGFTGWWRERYADWRKVLKFALWTNLTCSLELPFQELDKIVAAMVISVEAAGIFKVFKQLSMLVAKIAVPVYQAIYPQLSSLIALGEPDQAVQVAKRSGVVLLLFTLPTAIVCCLSSPWWMSHVFGPGYAGESAAFCLYFMLRAMSVGFISIHPLFIAMGFVQSNAAITGFANALYLLAGWFLGSHYGLMGLALAYGMQCTSIVVCKMYIISSRFSQLYAAPLRIEQSRRD